MNRTETVELVRVLETEEVKKLMEKEKDKADVEEQFNLKKDLLKELSGKIVVRICKKTNQKLSSTFRMKTQNRTMSIEVKR